MKNVNKPPFWRPRSISVLSCVGWSWFSNVLKLTELSETRSECLPWQLLTSTSVARAGLSLWEAHAKCSGGRAPYNTPMFDQIIINCKWLIQCIFSISVAYPVKQYPLWEVLLHCSPRVQWYIHRKADKNRLQQKYFKLQPKCIQTRALGNGGPMLWHNWHYD